MNDDDPLAETKPKRAGRRAPAKVTARSLENAALHHLERFSTSSEGLRRVLLRRVARAARHHDTDEAEAARWVDAVVEKMIAKGFVNDCLFAEGRTRTLLAQGVPLRAIRMRLREKGVADDLAADALALVAEDDGDVDLAAAIALAKRRRLGPFRGAAERGQRRDKDLAALARAGFGYDVARRVIDAASPEALEDLKQGEAGAGDLGYFPDAD